LNSAVTDKCCSPGARNDRRRFVLNPEQGHGSDGLDVANRLNQEDSQEATFADRLKTILQEKNITPEELADRIGCTQSAVSKILLANLAHNEIRSSRWLLH